MTREFTVVLKQTEPLPKSAASKFWAHLNEFIKSPLFSFLFGASIVTALPTIKDFFTPKHQLQLQQQEAHARADAILVAPLLSNLSADEPGKFQAVRAALQSLEESTTSTSTNDHPLFAAVNRAISAVGEVVVKPSEKSKLTPKVIKEINDNATPAPTTNENVNTTYARLRSASVFLHVDKDNESQYKVANKLLSTLKENRVLALGVERIASTKMPNETQVRYFNDDDRDMADALATVLGRATNRPVFTSKPPLPAARGTLEIWFGKN